jgi:hypothetical protein
MARKRKAKGHDEEPPEKIAKTDNRRSVFVVMREELYYDHKRHEVTNEVLGVFCDEEQAYSCALDAQFERSTKYYDEGDDEYDEVVALLDKNASKRQQYETLFKVAYENRYESDCGHDYIVVHTSMLTEPCKPPPTLLLAQAKSNELTDVEVKTSIKD